MNLPFEKWHGASNDFVFIHFADLPSTLEIAKTAKMEALALQICQRHSNIGADGIVVWSFEADILRIQILIKRGSQQKESETLESYSFGGNTVNFITYEIKGINGNTELSKKEIALMKLLIERKGEVVSREEILDSVWGKDAYPSSRTIDNYILAFRKYFEKNQREPLHFHSIRGVGYKFTE